MLAKLAESVVFVEGNRGRVVIPHLQSDPLAAMSAAVALAGLQQRATDAAASESNVDRERINAHRPPAFS